MRQNVTRHVARQGRGRVTACDGAIVSTKAWSNLRRQSLLPSFRDARCSVPADDTAPPSQARLRVALSCDYAFDGGSALVVHGTVGHATGHEWRGWPQVRVFSADVAVPFPSLRPLELVVEVVSAEQVGAGNTAEPAPGLPPAVPCLLVTSARGGRVVGPTGWQPVSTTMAGPIWRFPVQPCSEADATTALVPPVAPRWGVPVGMACHQASQPRWRWVRRAWRIDCHVTDEDTAVTEFRLAIRPPSPTTSGKSQTCVIVGHASVDFRQ